MSTDQRPAHSRASTTARAVGASRATAVPSWTTVIPACPRPRILDGRLVVKDAMVMQSPEEADVTQPDRVGALPHLVARALARAQPPAPIEGPGDLRLNGQLRRLDLDHTTRPRWCPADSRKRAGAGSRRRDLTRRTTGGKSNASQGRNRRPDAVPLEQAVVPDIGTCRGLDRARRRDRRLLTVVAPGVRRRSAGRWKPP